uniref:G-protein coupled receptor 35-like protein n=1 Tax=Callorhinchus milii TaxID=7868 RepID=V9L539_CALMI
MNCSSEINANVGFFQFIFSIPIFIIGIVLNALALWAFCWKLRKWTETIVYMANLAVSDLVLLFSLPFKIVSYRHRWFNESLCSFVESLYFVNMYVSIFIITCISIDRYIAIRHPFSANVLRSPMKAGMLSAAVWIIVCLWSIPVYVKYHAQPSNETSSNCFRQVSFDTDISITISLEIVGFIIPLITMTFCSVQIIQTLKQSNLNAREFDTTRTIRIITANVTIFIICFTPVHIGYFLQWIPAIREDCNNCNNLRLFMDIAPCIANINCCLDAFGYYFVSAEVRQLCKFKITQRRDSESNK